MAFGKKKAATGPMATQANVSLLATEALARLRSNRVRLAVTITLGQVLMNRWDQKSLVQMLGKMTGHDVPRGNKDLHGDYEASWYRNEKGDLALPCRVIKAAIVEGAISTDGLVSKAELKRELRVMGHTSPLDLHGKEIEMDVRLVKNQMTPDIRARAIVPAGATAEFVLDFPQTLSVDRVMAALTSAGATIGVCDWRPQKGGEFGTFEVTKTTGEVKEVERVIKACAHPEEQFVIPEYMLHAIDAIPENKRSDSQKKAAAIISHVNGQANGHANGKSRSKEATT
jgi:hypothetical protein